MSGIYIPGMDMPTSCWDCPMIAEDVCRATGYTISRHRNKSRDESCPLTPVPEHGDLIERDAIEYDWDEDNQTWGYDIYSAPVFIPADKGGEG